jgi:hypothetical protein
LTAATTAPTNDDASVASAGTMFASFTTSADVGQPRPGWQPGKSAVGGGSRPCDRPGSGLCLDQR